MFFQPLEDGKLEHAHTDERRIIFECNLSTSSVQLFEITAAIPLGNHYHKKRQETFVIVHGKGKCAYLSLDEKGRPLGEQIILSLGQGSVIQIKPFTAHALQLDSGSTMICYSSIPFDPDELDMFKYELEL